MQIFLKMLRQKTLLDVPSVLRCSCTKTAKLNPNPHSSHRGEQNCTNCHSVKGKPRLECNDCHTFRYQDERRISHVKEYFSSFFLRCRCSSRCSAVAAPAFAASSNSSAPAKWDDEVDEVDVVVLGCGGAEA